MCILAIFFFFFFNFISFLPPLLIADFEFLSNGSIVCFFCLVFHGVFFFFIHTDRERTVVGKLFCLLIMICMNVLQKTAVCVEWLVQ